MGVVPTLGKLTIPMCTHYNIELLLGIIFQKIRRHQCEAHKIVYTLGTDQIYFKNKIIAM